MIAVVEKILREQMRAIFHHGEFQQLEPAWRSLYFLVMNAETGPKLKIYLLDVSKAELEADSTKARWIENSGMCKNLSYFASGSEDRSWGALVGNYDFSMSREEIYMLDRLV